MAGDQPLDMRDQDAYDLGYAADFHILLRAIDLAMPTDAILYLEGDAIAPAVAMFLAQREAVDRRPVAANQAGRVEAFHLPLAGGNLHALRVLAEDHVRSEVARHLAVYRGDELLLWAHDAGDGIVELARSLPLETAERLRAELGGTLRTPKRRGWLSALRRARDQ
jgi:hypothetical protein